MVAPGNTAISRVTVVAPRSRIDLALPSDVPLADLLPSLLRYAGQDLADETADGWTLSRLGGLVLDASYTPAQLDVRDGELLYLRPRGDSAPMLVFDDVVDAVATAQQSRAGRWRAESTRRAGLGLGVTALLGGAAVVLFAGRPQLTGGLIGLGVAAALLVVAVILARAVGDTRSGVVLALVACVYAGVGGLLVAAGDRTVGQLAVPHVLIATTAVLLTIVLAAVGVADGAPVFLGTGACAVAMVAAATVRGAFGVDGTAAAAVVVTVALATLPALPLAAYRLARLPIPAVPPDPDSLRRDNSTVDSGRVLELSARADAYLAGMLGAVSAIAATAAIVVAGDGSYRATALSATLGLVLLGSARWYLGQPQRLPLLAAGALSLGAAAVAVFVVVDHTVRLTAILGAVLAFAAISTGVGLAGPRRKASPMWGRTLDILEVLLILAVVPLAAWVSGLYDWIRTLSG